MLGVLKREGRRVHIIRARFERLEDVTLADVYDRVGVYSLWSSRAESRPSYIGEGNLLKRFVEHLPKSWAARPVSGCLWLLDYDEAGLTELEGKLAVQAVEYALLAVAERIDCFPANNISTGMRASASRLEQKLGHKTIRINVTGTDPLRHPDHNRMSAKKVISLRAGEVETGGWRRS
jgi:hypothetical protein